MVHWSNWLTRLPFTQEITGSSPVCITINYLTVCTRTGGLDFYDYSETDNWLVSIKTGNVVKYSTNVFNHLNLDSLFASVAQLVVAPHL